MPCVAIKTDGATCGRGGHRLRQDDHPEHLQLCGIHLTQYNRRVRANGNVHHQPGQCFHFMTNGTWCRRPSEGGHMCCATHQVLQQRRADRHAAIHQRRELINLFIDTYLARDPLPAWQHVANEMFVREELDMVDRKYIACRYYLHWRVAPLDDPRRRFGHAVYRFESYWQWLVAGAPADRLPNLEFLGVRVVAVAPPQHDRDLARIAGDAQSVHTAAVTRQTNELERMLLEVYVKPDQKTEQTIAAAWFKLPRALLWANVLRNLNDIRQWFVTKSCRNVNDNLYRRILQGLVAKIELSPTEDLKMELYGRLYEECFESVGMCCEGHISRLCNVFVGFDEAFRPPVSLGELIQNAMAVIAAADLPVSERLEQANTWFAEFAVPVEERREWLIAIESM